MNAVAKAPAAAKLAAALSAFAVVAALAAPGESVAGQGPPQPPPSPSGAKLRPIGNFDNPTYVTQAPGEPGTVYVVEQPGRIVAVRQGRDFGRPFLDIRDRVRFGPNESGSVEAGLLSLAFDPRYPQNGRFYVFYTGADGNNYVDEYRRSGKRVLRANPASRQLVLKILHPYADSHNGGQLAFGPDGELWISSGDGGCCGDGQDQARSLGTLLGKLLRVNPRARKPGFRVPPTNPLMGLPGRDAIYSWGLRNPWRFSFDSLTGALFVADVGDNDNAEEEISMTGVLSARGTDFGWPAYEGFRLVDPARPGSGAPLMPVHSYRQKPNRCAVTGGFVSRDPRLPRLYGRYLYADYCTGRIRSFVPPAFTDAPGARPGLATDDRDEGLWLRYPSSFGQGLDGRLFVASQRGTVYRLAPRGGGRGGG